MKNNKFILTSVFVVLFGFTSFSQGGGIWNFDWNIGFATGETSELVSATSFRGFSIDGRGFVLDKLTVGGIVGWNTFYESKGYQTVDVGNNGVVYGYKRNTINTIPIMINTHYYFAITNVLPYAGIGIGTMYVESRDAMGIYYVKDDAWHFAIAPEVGVVVPLGAGNTGVNFNAKYNMAAKTKDSPAYGFVTLNIGISYVF